MPKQLPNSIKILFIGNSFTQRNNLPGLLAELAAAQGLRLTTELISAGGASLRTHWNAGRAAAAIAEGGYDYVVLQEQSTLPIKNALRMAENVRLFDQVIKRAGSQTVLYMTWARQHSPQTQELITSAYQSLGKELGAIVVPVGLAWQRFLAKHSTPVLYDVDQSHPTLAGTYLAACVFFAVLFQISPVGLGTGTERLEAEESKLLQRTAREAARAAGQIAHRKKKNDPNGTRTRVTAVKGRCPRPLDDGANAGESF